MTLDFSVAAIDVGSVAKNRFGWALRQAGQADSMTGSDPDELVDHLNRVLNDGGRLALGFECPLFLPVRKQAKDLSAQRPEDAGMAWSASAGATVATLGIVQATWVLQRLQDGALLFPTMDPDGFSRGNHRLLLWEAIVTRDSKTDSHENDAAAAVDAFVNLWPIPPLSNEEPCISLIGAASLRAGLTEDVGFLNRACCVVRPQAVRHE